MNGLKLAALYGLKPHQLGFCGSQNKQGVLLKYLKNQDVNDEKAREVLKTFEAAYPYYKLIAKSNNVKDPFDEQVIMAYWVGNELLEKAGGFKSHHSHHVLVVGSVTGRVVLKGKLLDLCRISWGKITKLKVNLPAGKAGSQKLKVVYQPLTGKKKLKLGKPIEKEIDWDKDLLPKIKVGDWVSFHWNQAVAVLTEKDVKNLEKYTKITLESLRR